MIIVKAVGEAPSYYDVTVSWWDRRAPSCIFPLYEWRCKLEIKPDDVHRTAAPSSGGIENVYNRVIVAQTQFVSNGFNNGRKTLLCRGMSQQ